ncbi:MAG: FAD-linked oxidase C-terminal domain-containing protein [Desulfobacterium sp.]
MLRGYSLVSETVKKIAGENEARLIVIATHMHAGDGNVHVNIPVLSNDREMMARAAATADAVMEEAVTLGGVVSGEHGIGITKIKHLPEKNIQALEAYRNIVDPSRIMNPGKLCDTLVADKVFTPSFNLLELEASILHHGSLGALSSSIANCVRCGRCKDSYPVFYPHQNLFFHPRNKNLAVGALIEALLYETQRTHSTEFKVLSYLEEIADHCTICHKCYDKCPVNIDSGKVSILEREILNEKRVKHKALPTRLSLSYLKSRNELVNTGMRALMVSMGTRAQQLAVKTVQHLPEAMNMKQRRLAQRFLFPMATPPARTLRSITPKAGLNQAILAEPSGKAAGTVFYFPGCGSERLFSQIGKASLFLLLHHGIRVILPPPFLCCGFPFKTSAENEQAKMLSLRNTIIFSQIRGMFSDLDFDAVIISCGTCLESLTELNTDHIFNCGLSDISQFIIDRGCNVQLETDCCYHAPCHDSLKGQGEEILRTITSGIVRPVPFCCSEAGTMSLSRPDISNAMLIRKQQAIRECIPPDDAESIILTNCPSCIQGLSRNAGSGIRPVHMAEHLALTIGGPDWETALNRYMTNCEVISF